MINNIITAIKCLDGKKHHWRHILNPDSYGNNYRNSWCSKCGSKTEWVGYYPENSHKLSWTRCTRNNKEIYIEIPALLPQIKRRKETWNKMQEEML